MLPMNDLSCFNDFGGCRFAMASVFVIWVLHLLPINYGLANSLRAEKNHIWNFLMQDINHPTSVTHFEQIFHDPLLLSLRQLKYHLGSKRCF